MTPLIEPAPKGRAVARPLGVRPHQATWRELLRQTASSLREAGNDNSAQEACWLVQRAGGFDAAALQIALERPATPEAGALVREMVDRRLRGEPLQYICGRWGFRGLELRVDRRVLIPRPETELLVGAALSECARLGAQRAADLGSGSGAIALSLAAERVGLDVWATDISSDALAVAQANQTELGGAATGVRFAQGWWFDALPDDLRGGFNLIVSNPPYVAEPEIVDLPDEVRDWEPAVALMAGPSGLDHITAILTDAPAWLTRPGVLLLEIAPHRAREAENLARRAGFGAVSVWPDLAGRDRILQARLC